MSLTAEEETAARHMADAVNLHVAAQAALGRESPGYVVIQLSDGKSPDGVLYDNRREAAAHHAHNPYVTFVRVGVETMPVNEAALVLQMHRRAYKAGVRFVEEEVITPHLSELMLPFIPRTLKGIR